MSLSSTHGGPAQLTSGEVHCWCVSLDVSSDAYGRLHSVLTGDERSRSERFRFEHDRRRFVVARGALRDVLGRYLGTEPDRIRFVSNAWDKPGLSPEFGTRLRFNLSHSAGLALIAVAADAEVGVDLERVRSEDCAEIAQHFFSAAEADELNTVPRHLRTRAFFSCWTRREAYVKARGEGLGDGPIEFCGRWSFFPLQPAPGYVGALAVEGTGWRLGIYRYSEIEIQPPAGFEPPPPPPEGVTPDGGAPSPFLKEPVGAELDVE